MSAPTQPPPSSVGGYKRASRKGAPRRYACSFPTCDKIYSRQEHLQRHQLNHTPKEIFICDVQNCNQRFVRADLLARHRKRHSSSYTPRNRVQSFTEPSHGPHISISPLDDLAAPSVFSPLGAKPGDAGSESAVSAGAAGAAGTAPASAERTSFDAHQLSAFSHPPSVPHDASILLTPDSSGGTLSSQALAQAQAQAQAQAHARAQAQSHGLQQPSPEWATNAPLGHMAGCDVVSPDKTAGAGFYPAHPPHPGHPGHSGHPAHPQHHARTSSHTLPDQPIALPYNSMQMPDSSLVRDYFTMWLFDNQANYGDFNIGQLPFFETGLETPFNNTIQYDYESLTSRSRGGDTPPRQLDSEESLTESRRQELLAEFEYFRMQRSRPDSGSQHASGDGKTATPPPLDTMNDCLYEYWEHVSPRVPIIHQPTFSCNTCPPLLLLVMIALGAASLHGHHGARPAPNAAHAVNSVNAVNDPAGVGMAEAHSGLVELGDFADSTITKARWEILTVEEASPPVSLWVAQALLLLEFYEKMYSSRRLHERSHIYHSSTLTLLRRGSPLIGRSGSESPPDEAPALSMATTPAATVASPELAQHPPQQPPPPQQNDWHAWWMRWAETEAMHRVVFAAFCFDVTHAAMFGHAADMAPYEIRLPLPCDDNLWTAWKPEDVRKLDADLRMYGVKPIFFLDGLKRALHGQEVKTHSFGRMIIMSGLLSVGWHLSHREKHMNMLDLKTPTSDPQDSWRTVLLRAFENWKESFDLAQGAAGAAHSLSSESSTVLSAVSASVSQRGASNGPIQSAAVLYHLAHISLHVDIVDCQVYAGVKRLIGRKVTARDYTNVCSRMKKWAGQPSTRHAILHAFRLLHHVLVNARESGRFRHRLLLAGPHPLDQPGGRTYPYSFRTESDPHRPWIMYYASLSIWAFVHAINGGPESKRPLNNLGIAEPVQRELMYQTGGGGGGGGFHQQSLPTGHGLSSPPPHLQHHQHTHLQPGTHVQPFGGLHDTLPVPLEDGMAAYHRVAAYLSRVAEVPELTDMAASSLSDGLPDLLDYLQKVFSEARSELMQEACVRLKKCRDILLGMAG